MLRTISIIGSLIAALGCGASGNYVWVHEHPPEPADERILIGAGDLLEINVYGEEQSSTTGRVLADGTLTIPLIGPVRVAGQRPEDLAATLTQQLKAFITSPNVTVVIREAVVSVSVIGEVRNSRAMQLVAPATVIEALAEAGGLSEFADDDCIFVLRKHGQATERIRFTYDALIEAEPAATKFQLQSGDVVVVD